MVKQEECVGAVRLDAEVTQDNLKEYVIRCAKGGDDGFLVARQRLTADSPWYALQAALDLAAAEKRPLFISEQANAWLKDRNPDRPETNQERIDRLEDELLRQQDINRRDPLRRSVYDEHDLSQESKMFRAAAAFAALPGQIPTAATPDDLANLIIGCIRKLRAKLNEPAYTGAVAESTPMPHVTAYGLDFAPDFNEGGDGSNVGFPGSHESGNVTDWWTFEDDNGIKAFFGDEALALFLQRVVDPARWKYLTDEEREMLARAIRTRV